MKTKRNNQKGLSHTPEYAIWRAMLNRCTNPNSNDWRLYGGRGITVCERWKGADGFLNFIKDVGARPNKKLSLDRTMNHLGYCPENVEWRDAKSQVHNRRKLGDITQFSDEDIINYLKRHEQKEES